MTPQSASQPLLCSSSLLRGLRKIRKLDCTFGADRTPGVFAWDEYIYSALSSVVLDGVDMCTRQVGSVGDGVGIVTSPVIADGEVCSLSIGLLIFAIAGCLLC